MGIPQQLLIRTTFLLAIGMVCTQANAITHYQSGISDSEWLLSGDIFSCSLTHPVPNYGEGHFIKEAGEPMKFILQPQNEKLGPGQVYIISQAPDWSPGLKPETLEILPYPGYGLTVEVGGRVAERMLTSLDRGRHPVVAGTAWENNRETIEVGLSNINFAPAYNEFRRCLSSLLPVNYDQIARTAALFPTNGVNLTDRIKARLDLVALYVSSDPSVEYIYIDGHTDVIGSRRDNRELSKVRAEKVTSYLLEKGVPAGKIISRYHGERYPSTTNNTAQGRERNRRVTIRLEKSSESS
ncbi:MAG: OmpA family protein [Gammaproteobacteria bacterium]|uniref:flagellar protein MotY n=1 Tax=Marinomonas TaxID=28253 RepID=UPI000C1DFFDE|nr:MULTISPECIES: OmpA family protein [unclassified Marinomonas]MBU1293370.1 OmpA family protein [Gammaproteobacteria bacterium]MBU1466252.1 OmpA family protein [Gammaproteobacteria bacterium]MBU2318201.1 OmpA family protein [Gammaproteobacteria bacterium]MBU2415417.1 OmpA family protein [Gammaproteobacteria bacterium]PJE54930.1 membrane protein [Marinomonas sp. BSi20584]